MASRALPPAFDQRHPARLNRLQTICLQALSTTPEPPESGRSLIVLIQSFRSLYRGAAAFTAASTYWRAWNRSRTKVASCAGKASSQALRIQGAPSDRHRQFLGREHAVPEPELLQAGTKSEARLMPFMAFAPSMQTPTAPLPLSLLDSPIVNAGAKLPKHCNPRATGPRDARLSSHPTSESCKSDSN